MFKKVDIMFTESATFGGEIGFEGSPLTVDVEKGEVWVGITITTDTHQANSSPSTRKTCFKKDIKEKGWVDYVGSTDPKDPRPSYSIPVNIFKIVKEYDE